LPERAAEDSPFWRYSLRFYALPDVAPACLVLQDEGGADVNLLLLLLFLAEANKQATPDDVRRLDAVIAIWREETVKPLRNLRRRLKAGVAGMPADKGEHLRNHIKRVELEAERIEQKRLEQEASSMTFVSSRSRAEAAKVNLAAYKAYLGSLPEDALKIILAAFTKSLPSPP